MLGEKTEPSDSVHGCGGVACRVAVVPLTSKVKSQNVVGSSTNGDTTVSAVVVPGCSSMLPPGVIMLAVASPVHMNVADAWSMCHVPTNCETSSLPPHA